VLFKMNVRSACKRSAITHGRPGKDTPVNVVSLVASTNIAASNPLYYLQAIRSNARDSKTGGCLCEPEYKQVEKYAAELLALGLSTDSFDAFVAAPTCRRQLQDTFAHSVQARLVRGTLDLTANLSVADTKVKSDSSHSMEERIENLHWSEALDWTLIRRVLIVDDVISKGRTAVPLIQSIQDQCSATACVFTICAPLWIIRNDEDSWLVPCIDLMAST
jgi:hypothetical protein